MDYLVTIENNETKEVLADKQPMGYALVVVGCKEEDCPGAIVGYASIKDLVDMATSAVSSVFDMLYRERNVPMAQIKQIARNIGKEAIESMEGNPAHGMLYEEVDDGK